MLRRLLLFVVLVPVVAADDPFPKGLTFHASFDNGAKADFARGDRSIYTIPSRKADGEGIRGIATDKTRLESTGGVTGGALRFTDREAAWLYYQADKNLPYSRKDWSGTVSFWLKVDPAKLPPGFTDPVQITTRAWNDAAFFVDFTKDDVPRKFRLGAFADLAVWNPNEDKKKLPPESDRPLFTVDRPPFEAGRWTHVAFTWQNFNSGAKDGLATLYLNGQPKGNIGGWNQHFDWKDNEQPRILIGVNFVGLFDDLACFDRCLTAKEIASIPARRRQRQLAADDSRPLRRAMIDGRGPGWRTLTSEDFTNVNCKPDTWRWDKGTAYCSGNPVGVIRSRKQITNFEMVAEWKHKKSGGNSGIFVWATPKSIETCAAGKARLPHGIEVQVLDLGYAEQYKKRHKKPADWFTSHGDVFPTGSAKMKPFPPVAPNGRRSFPSKNLTKGINQWNHYYIRAINGEVRLWVNGEEVSGGTNCEPRTGYLCLESEGAPIEFRNMRIRELP